MNLNEGLKDLKKKFMGAKTSYPITQVELESKRWDLFPNLTQLYLIMQFNVT